MSRHVWNKFRMPQSLAYTTLLNPLWDRKRELWSVVAICTNGSTRRLFLVCAKELLCGPPLSLQRGFIDELCQSFKWFWLARDTDNLYGWFCNQIPSIHPRGKSTSSHPPSQAFDHTRWGVPLCTLNEWEANNAKECDPRDGKLGHFRSSSSYLTSRIKRVKVAVAKRLITTGLQCNPGLLPTLVKSLLDL